MGEYEQLIAIMTILFLLLCTIIVNCTFEKEARIVLNTVYTLAIVAIFFQGVLGLG